MEILTKICNRCNKEKDLDSYGLDKRGKYGKKSICKTCTNDYHRIFYTTNKVIISEKNKERNAKPEVKIKRKQKSKEWRDYKLSVNLDLERLKRREKQQERRKDPMFKIIEATRNRIRNSIKHSGNRKNSKTSQILGCSFDEFRTYLESKFEPWMNWNNRGRYNGTPEYGWDIDHIIPTSSATTEEDIIKLNHYTNLQPLCSFFNRDIKRNKLK